MKPAEAVTHDRFNVVVLVPIVVLTLYVLLFPLAPLVASVQVLLSQATLAYILIDIVCRSHP